MERELIHKIFALDDPDFEKLALDVFRFQHKNLETNGWRIKLTLAFV